MNSPARQRNLIRPHLRASVPPYDSPDSCPPPPNNTPDSGPSNISDNGCTNSLHTPYATGLWHDWLSPSSIPGSLPRNSDGKAILVTTRNSPGSAHRISSSNVSTPETAISSTDSTFCRKTSSLERFGIRQNTNPNAPFKIDYGLIEKLLEDDGPADRPQYNLEEIPDMNSILNYNPVLPVSASINSSYSRLARPGFTASNRAAPVMAPMEPEGAAQAINMVISQADPENENAANTSGVSEDGAVAENDHEPYFEPVVYLKEVQVKTNEEDEEEMMKLRCKLYRYHTAETPGEWKELGTGDVKILLKHTKKQSCRLLMLQDKTLKIRANHYITPYMGLKPNCGSDRAWVWSVADFADEEPKQECFAIRFANAENAQLFKEKFNEARGIVTVAEVEDRQKDDSDYENRGGREASDEENKEADEVTKERGKMSVRSKQ